MVTSKNNSNKYDEEDIETPVFVQGKGFKYIFSTVTE